MRHIILALLLMSAGAAAHAEAPALPYHDQIMAIIAPMEYSGFPALIKPQTTLTLDIDKREWVLRNVNEYDAEGTLMLVDGRYGLCGRLSANLYGQLRKLLPDGRFVLRFAKVTEPDFFLQEASNHIVLLMLDTSNGEEYMIDASFHRYGRIADFPTYKVIGIQDNLSFLKALSADNRFKVDQAMPLSIKGDMMTSFAVTSVDGKFDRENFLLVLSVNERHRTELLDLMAFGKHDGQLEKVQRRRVLEKVLTPEEIQAVDAKMDTWVQGIVMGKMPEAK